MISKQKKKQKRRMKMIRFKLPSRLEYPAEGSPCGESGNLEEKDGHIKRGKVGGGYGSPPGTPPNTKVRLIGGQGEEKL